MGAQLAQGTVGRSCKPMCNWGWLEEEIAVYKDIDVRKRCGGLLFKKVTLPKRHWRER